MYLFRRRGSFRLTVPAVIGLHAQQAELKDVERNLGTKISKLDQRDKELQQTVKQAKMDVDKLVSETRARLSQEISALREEELPAASVEV